MAPSRISPLVHMLLRLLTDHIEDVESLWGLPDVLRVSCLALDAPHPTSSCWSLLDVRQMPTALLMDTDTGIVCEGLSITCRLVRMPLAVGSAFMAWNRKLSIAFLSVAESPRMH